MTITFFTKNIDKKTYTDIIERTIMLNGHDGNHKSSYEALERFRKDWQLNIIPVTDQEDFKAFYNHLDIEVSDGIAWGVTGSKVIFMFVNDSKNPFILRQNIMPLAHELLHAIYSSAENHERIYIKDAEESKFLGITNEELANLYRTPKL